MLEDEKCENWGTLCTVAFMAAFYFRDTEINNGAFQNQWLLKFSLLISLNKKTEHFLI